jgi:RasGEF N-terminal motif/RasGEF domain
MLTSSLCKISRRRQATVTDHTGPQQAGPHTGTLLPQISDNSADADADALTQKTESIHSDDAIPSSSTVIVPSIPRFRLEESFPSILSTVDVMKGLKKSKEVDGILSLSQVFSTCLRTIIRSMDVLPREVRLDPAYEVAQYGVIFTGNLFSGQVHKMISSSGPTGVEMLCMALEIVELTVSSLRTFLTIAGKLVSEIKPLPALPIVVAVVPAVEEPAPLVNIVNEVMDSDDNAGATSSEDFSTSHMNAPGTTVPLEKRKRRLSKSSIIRRIVGRGSIASKASLFTHKTKSSATLVARDALTTDVKERLPEPRFVLRQSALYYLADPYCPEIDVEMPVPTGDTVAVRLDQNGTMKAASLTALVRMLTSRDSVLDPELATTFFICFRFFTTPTRFFEGLINRFDEQPSAHLNPAQLRIWTREAMAVRIRVGKVILMWLDLYWKPDMDHEVLEALQTFALDRLVQECPEGLVGHILEGLDSVSGDKPFCRRARKAKDLDFIYQQSMVGTPLPGPIFEITIDAGLAVTAQLLKLNTPSGREEVARQLTVRMSDLFQQVDPEDAVMHWHRHGNQHSDHSEVGRTLQQIVQSECALCFWITHTVLQLSTLSERCRLLEFWLDIATVSIHDSESFFQPSGPMKNI